ncbi:MAG TPA: hypothetical protein VFN88_01420, partial [Caulobacteraceae bacterium]|nr:hypothetical protein [Caulobacteraceae bacterium]
MAVLFVDSLTMAGIANAAILALACGWAARWDRRWAWLCALFSLLATSVTAILLSHRLFGMAERAALAAEQLSWFVGPTLFHYVQSASGYPARRRTVLIGFLLPAVL